MKYKSQYEHDHSKNSTFEALGIPEERVEAIKEAVAHITSLDDVSTKSELFEKLIEICEAPEELIMVGSIVDKVFDAKMKLQKLMETITKKAGKRGGADAILEMMTKLAEGLGADKDKDDDDDDDDEKGGGLWKDFGKLKV